MSPRESAWTGRARHKGMGCLGDRESELFRGLSKQEEGVSPSGEGADCSGGGERRVETGVHACSRDRPTHTPDGTAARARPEQAAGRPGRSRPAASARSWPGSGGGADTPSHPAARRPLVGHRLRAGPGLSLMLSGAHGRPITPQVLDLGRRGGGHCWLRPSPALPVEAELPPQLSGIAAGRHQRLPRVAGPRSRGRYAGAGAHSHERGPSSSAQGQAGGRSPRADHVLCQRLSLPPRSKASSFPGPPGGPWALGRGPEQRRLTSAHSLRLGPPASPACHRPGKGSGLVRIVSFPAQC